MFLLRQRRRNTRHGQRRDRSLEVEMLEPRTLLSPIDLGELGGRGVTFTHTGPGTVGQTTFAAAGDVNGDSVDDILLADPLACCEPHRAYLFYGRAEWPQLIDARQWTPDVLFESPTALTASTAGDINGDGLADMLFGAPYESGNGQNPRSALTGRAYLVYGRRSLPSTIDLSSLGELGIILEGGDPNDNRRLTGYVLAPAGDVNHDNYSDFLVLGAVSTTGRSSSRAHLVFGGPKLPAAIDLGAPGDLARTIVTERRDCGRNDLGISSLSAAGDVNGDSFSDFLVGAVSSDICGSQVFLVYGSAELPPTITLTAADPIGPVFSSNGSGADVAPAGDVDRDGFDDFLLGLPQFAIPYGCEGYEPVLVYGGPSLPTTVHLSRGLPCQNPAPLGIRLTYLPKSRAGDVSGVGDTNGDGSPDVLVGLVPIHSPLSNQKPRALLIYGSATLPNQTSLVLEGNAPGPWKIFQGIQRDDGTGRYVAPAGDVNADGFADFFIWAPGFVDPDNARGRIYLVFGRETESPFVHSVKPAGLVTGPVRRITVTLSEPTDPSSFTTDDVVLEGPDGPIPIRRIRHISDTTFRLRFPQQTLLGEYHLTLGPDITDLVGNAMDQPHTSSFHIVPRTFVFTFLGFCGQTGQDPPSGMEKLRTEILDDEELARVVVAAPPLGWPAKDCGTRRGVLREQITQAHELVDSVLAAHQATSRDRLVFIGHSFGGNLAYRLARETVTGSAEERPTTGLITFDPIDWQHIKPRRAHVHLNQSNEEHMKPAIAGITSIVFVQRNADCVAPLRLCGYSVHDGETREFGHTTHELIDDDIDESGARLGIYETVKNFLRRLILSRVL